MVKQFSTEDFPDREIEACKRVLVEALNLLKDHADHIALIGGWVPYYLIPDGKPAHIGSLDVDLCFNHKFIDDPTYDTIANILTDNDYFQQPERNKPAQWLKDVKVDSGDPIRVKLDLLATEFSGTGGGRRHQDIQDAKAQKAHGSDLIFDGATARFEEVVINERRPDGAKDSVKCKVAGVVPFIVMKGMCLGRGKPKDAYDIEYVISNYPAGTKALIVEFKRDGNEPLVREGLGKIRAKFQSPNHTGPVDVVTFLGIEYDDDRELRQRVAFETVTELLDALNIELVV